MGCGRGFKEEVDAKRHRRSGKCGGMRGRPWSGWQGMGGIGGRVPQVLEGSGEDSGSDEE